VSQVGNLRRGIGRQHPKGLEVAISHSSAKKPAWDGKKIEKANTII